MPDVALAATAIAGPRALARALVLTTQDPSIGDTVDTSSLSATGVPVPEIESGGRVGRYVILSRVGAGAMGVVFAAYDPELDRKVAVKLLKHRDADTADAQTRLQREALALAKLNNPNVVSVHDVGVHAGQVFLAMEFVEGRTLRGWIADAPGGRPRPWREVVAVFAAAGRGLAAAHAQGLIHRDFKPDNVMLGDDGRVRVMDFGLARPSELSTTIDRQVVSTSTSQRALTTSLTQTGAMVGTPAYMAPEQFEGTAGARSDQFAYCVALYEALFGQRPFSGKNVSALLDAIDTRQFEPTRAPASVPAWLRAVVVRGLAADQERRWPSMTALIEALTDDPAQRRRRWAAALTIAGLLVGVTGGVAWALERRARVCTGFESQLAGVWDDDPKSRVRAAIEGTGLSYAPDTWRRVRERLDDYSGRWVQARREACEASQRGEQSGELLDLRMRCLDERLQHVAATVGVLGEADREVVREAVQSVANLPRLERCADLEALMAEQPPPEDVVAARVAALDEQLIAARAQERAGSYKRGLQTAESVLADAETLGYEPLDVRARLTAGTLQIDTAAHAEAEATLERAYESAVGLKMTAEAAIAARQLVYVVGVRLGRHDDGHQWAKNAKPLARAVGTQEVTAEILYTLGILATEEGRYAEARGHLERALAIYEEVLGPDHPKVAEVLGSLVGLAGIEGKYDEVRTLVERALAISETALGPSHPSVGLSLSNLGNLELINRDLAKARAYYERALAIFEAAHGPDHPNVAAALSNLGSVAHREDHNEEALAYLTRALAIQERQMGPDHPGLITPLTLLGIVAKAEKRYEVARDALERALAIGEKARGPDHPSLADTLTNLGNIALTEARYDEARAYAERGVAGVEKGLGPDHVRVAYSLMSLGKALLGLGAADEAVPHVERALALLQTNKASSTELAEASFHVARALWDATAGAGRDRPRARELAGFAEASFEAAGYVEHLAEVRDWQAAHTPGAG